MQRLDATPALLTLAGLLPFSTWWFTEVRLLPFFPDPALAPLSTDTLTAFLAVQAIGLSLLGPFLLPAASRSERPLDAIAHALRTVAVAMVPAVPFVALLGYAAGIAIVPLALAGAKVGLLVCLVLTAASLARSLTVSVEMQRLLLSGTGAIAALLMHAERGRLMPWIIA